MLESIKNGLTYVYLLIPSIEKLSVIGQVLTRMPYWFIGRLYLSSQIFHTDRGKEFKNKLLNEALETFGVNRSLSIKGCPYDNAVAEATFKSIKTEFVKGWHFDSLEELTSELQDYVHWFNYIRIHGTLGYMSPINYKLEYLKKVA
jgi:transposase InsO family protein